MGSHLLNAQCIADSAVKNLECVPTLTGFSLNVHNECTPDCKDDQKVTSTFNTPGFHAVDGLCTDDTKVPAINTECAEKKLGYSIN